MRVALVSLARRGGMVHFMAELTNALVPLCEVTVVRSAGVDASYFDRTARQIAINTGRGAFGSLLQALNPVSWWRLLRAVTAGDVDLVHITGVHPLNPGIALICRSAGKPLVYTLHDAVPHPGAPWILTAADRTGARWAKRVVALSHEGRQQLIAAGFPPGSVVRILHPMYTLFRRWKPSDVKKRRIILCIGRLEPYKGLDVLVDGFELARPQLPGWKLIIAGIGKVNGLPSTQQNIRVQAAYLTDRQMAKLAYQAAFIALPYTSASQSGVLALAYAVGCPVVASSVGGMGEMLVDGRTGLLVPPGSPKALADAMRKLAGNPRRLARMRRIISDSDKAPWMPERVARAHMQVYRKVLKRGVR